MTRMASGLIANCPIVAWVTSYRCLGVASEGVPASSLAQLRLIKVDGQNSKTLFDSLGIL